MLLYLEFVAQQTGDSKLSPQWQFNPLARELLHPAAVPKKKKKSLYLKCDEIFLKPSFYANKIFTDIHQLW